MCQSRPHGESSAQVCVFQIQHPPSFEFNPPPISSFYASIGFWPFPSPTVGVIYMDDPSPGRTADHVTLNLLASLQMLHLEKGVYLSQGEGDINHAMLAGGWNFNSRLLNSEWTLFA